MPTFWVTLLLVAPLLGGCGDDPTPQSANFEKSGPFAAGVTTFVEQGREVVMWYPADRGAVAGLEPDLYYVRDYLPDFIDALLPPDANPPMVTDAFRGAAPADGRFHTVVFAHGFASFPTQSSFLTSHLATRGFVVVAPAYEERSLASALGAPPAVPLEDVEVSRLAVEVARRADEGDPALQSDYPGGGSAFAGRIETARVAIVGHSAGGGSSVRFAAEPDVIAYVPLSAGFRDDGTPLPDKPSLWLTGAIDGVVSLERVEAAFAAAASPAGLVVVEDAGHLAPTDLCAIGEEGGGIVQIALDGGLPVPENLQRLGTDGCQEGALAVTDGWSVFKSYVTGFLQGQFAGIEGVGIPNPGETAPFAPAVVHYAEK